MAFAYTYPQPPEGETSANIESIGVGRPFRE